MTQGENEAPVTNMEDAKKLEKKYLREIEEKLDQLRDVVSIAKP